MIVERLELSDFRNYGAVAFELTTGVTAVLGDNGQGKTNAVEALAYLSTLSSFRGVPAEALIRQGADVAIVRASVVDDDGRRSSIEAEIARTGRHRVLVNRQRLGRARDLLGVVRVTVFAPDDLVLVKGSPSDRRGFLDDTLVALAVKHDATRLEVDRVLRQRNRLLKQAGGRASPEIVSTLDVWDAKLVESGSRLGVGRAALVGRLGPLVAEAYGQLTGGSSPIDLEYVAPWRACGLADALVEARADDLRRGVSTVGPHRDELVIRLEEMPARTHASQGEQRTLALALRLAAHRLIAERTGTTPVLVLDDVLSELDPGRGRALLEHVPPGQVVITSASPLPPEATPSRIVRVSRGVVLAVHDVTG